LGVTTAVRTSRGHLAAESAVVNPSLATTLDEVSAHTRRDGSSSAHRGFLQGTF
jgi:hypothetical protein